VLKHDVLVSIDPAFARLITADWLAGIARVALETEQIGPCELGILVTGDEEIRSLNRDYAGEDKATDVLSFSLREGEEFVDPEGTDRLGEVIISYDTALRQAAEAGRTVDDETAHLLVHGVLHLLGYDHAEPDQESVMREREAVVLAAVK
jgi:probable rRNA maturation factor